MDKYFLENISELLYRFTEQSRDVFWIRSVDYKKQIYVSAAYDRIWGRSRQKLYKNPETWNECLYPEDLQRLNNSIRKRNQDIMPGEKFFEWYRISRPDGELRWIEDESFPIFDENNNLISFAGIAKDITESKLSEEALRIAKEEAQQANQAKSNFLAIVSHELRTPLNAILGMAQILIKERLTEKQKEYVEDIFKSGNNLLTLVNGILDFSKLEAKELKLKPAPFEFVNLLHNIMSEIKYLLVNKKLKLITESQNIPDYLIGDELHIKQIIVNLLNNAIKFSKKGYIKISARGELQSSNICILKIIVEDTGIGIPQSQLENIFERFTQIESQYSRSYQGTGLGLAICKQLTELMHGHIGVESTLNKGSKFWVEIPLEVTSKNQLPQKLKTNNLLVDTQYHILLVEDQPINQKVTKILLEQLNCRVDIAATGKEALKLVKERDYDLVLMDISLPDLDGMAITKKIRKMKHVAKNLPIIALTAHAFAEEKRNFLISGMDDVLTKPIDVQQILKTLKSIKSHQARDTTKI